jgi:hypothetical protein
MMKLLKMLIYSVTIGLVMGAASFGTSVIINWEDKIPVDQVKKVTVIANSNEYDYNKGSLIDQAKLADVVDGVKPVRIAETSKETTGKKMANVVTKNSKARTRILADETDQAKTTTQINDEPEWLIILPEIVIKANVEPLAITKYRPIAKVTCSKPNLDKNLLAQAIQPHRSLRV